MVPILFLQHVFQKFFIVFKGFPHSIFCNKTAAIIPKYVFETMRLIKNLIFRLILSFLNICPAKYF